MFFVSEDFGNGMYAVTDTSDWVTENYSASQLRSIVFNEILDTSIRGVIRRGNQVSINTYIPDLDDYFEINGTSPAQGINLLVNVLAAEFTIMREVLHHLTGYSVTRADIELLDGFACVGFRHIQAEGDYYLSIYLNPDVEMNNGSLTLSAHGFGMDVVDARGNLYSDNLDCHFDSNFKDYKKDLPKWEWYRKVKKH